MSVCAGTLVEDTSSASSSGSESFDCELLREKRLKNTMRFSRTAARLRRHKKSGVGDSIWEGIEEKLSEWGNRKGDCSIKHASCVLATLIGSFLPIGELISNQDAPPSQQSNCINRISQYREARKG